MRFFMLISLLTAYLSVQGQVITTDAEDLTGRITRSDLKAEPFSGWFNDEYASYNVQADELEGISMEGIEILIFMGTWCPDSRQEVPRFYKILDHLQASEKRLTVIAVDEDKIRPEEEIQRWKVEYVPTFIFLKNGKEAGRIVEYPATSLEQDMQQILR